MKISESEVRYVADLAHLKLSDEEVHRYRRDLDDILSYIDQLNELDTSNVEPMAQVLYDAGETATLREDVDRPGIGSELATANSAQAGQGYFKVPKVIER